MPTVASPPALLTAEQYWALPDDAQWTELVRGRIVSMPNPGFNHGRVCSRFIRVIGRYLDSNDIGHLISNDAGVITERGPDTVRGPDVSFYSYSKIPRSESPRGYPAVSPELTIEVKSPSDRWNSLRLKAGELLNAGVTVVCIADPDREKIELHRVDDPVQILKSDETLELPDVLPGFSVPVRQLFE